MRITKWMVAVAATCTAMPVLAMDDQATWVALRRAGREAPDRAGARHRLGDLGVDRR